MTQLLNIGAVAFLVVVLIYALRLNQDTEEQTDHASLLFPEKGKPKHFAKDESYSCAFRLGSAPLLILIMVNVRPNLNPFIYSKLIYYRQHQHYITSLN